MAGESRQRELKRTARLAEHPWNHSETLVRDNGKNLKVKTALGAGYKSAIPLELCIGIDAKLIAIRMVRTPARRGGHGAPNR